MVYNAKVIGIYQGYCRFMKTGNVKGSTDLTKPIVRQVKSSINKMKYHVGGHGKLLLW